MLAKTTVLLAPTLFGLTSALPLIPLPGKTTAHAQGAASLEAFANAYLGSTTAGTVHTWTDITAKLGLDLNLATTLSTLFSAKFTKWANTQCLANYHEPLLCGEVSAYLAATVYAAQRGWAAVEFFAALGAERVGHWHDAIDELCGTPGCPSTTCDVVYGNWEGWYSTYNTLSASVYAQEALELKTTGLLAQIDAAIKAKIHATANVNAKANASVDANAHSATVAHRGLLPLDALADVKAAADAAADLDVLGLIGVKAGVKADADVLAHVKTSRASVPAILLDLDLDLGLAPLDTDVTVRGLLPALDVLTHGSAAAAVDSDLNILGLIGAKTKVNAGADILGQVKTGNGLLPAVDALVHGSAAAAVDSDLNVLGLIGAKTKFNADADVLGHVKTSRGLLPAVDALVHGSAAADVASKLDVLGLASLKTGVKAAEDVKADAHVHRALGLGLDTVVKAATSADLNSNLNLLGLAGLKADVKADVNANVVAVAGAHVPRDVSAIITGATKATVGTIASVNGDGFALIDKEGLLAAGNGEVKVGHTKITGSNSIIVS